MRERTVGPGNVGCLLIVEADAKEAVLLQKGETQYLDVGYVFGVM